MASVDFAIGMFLHDSRNPEDYITGRRREPTYSQRPLGRVQITASGRRRWVARRGLEKNFTVTLRTRLLSDRKWIEARKGQTVLYRDKRGRLDRVVVSDVTVSDLQPDVYDITISGQVVDEDQTPLEGGV